MASIAAALRRGFDPEERLRLAGCYGIVLLLHIAGWGLLAWQSQRFPALLGLGALAYSFGLRHAFDADHIAAIDNTTRKLLRGGQKPIAAGFFFSLGHSTVVFLIALALGMVAKAVVNSVVNQNGQLKSLGALVGTSVSGAFLVLIGLLNLVILLDIVSTYRHMRRGEYDGSALEQRLVSGGVLTRVLGGLFRFITASWQLYPLGFLFGLGFDTASEVALLAISAGAASQGLPFLALVSLPLIFAAGMTLMDTTDGAFMSKAYLWAFAQPTRKLFYNLTMTGLSVFIALFVGLLELLQIVARVANLHGAFWDWAGNFDLSTLGFVIVAAFIVAWLIAFGVFKARRVEERWAGMVEAQKR